MHIHILVHVQGSPCSRETHLHSVSNAEIMPLCSRIVPLCWDSESTKRSLLFSLYPESFPVNFSMHTTQSQPFIGTQTYRNTWPNSLASTEDLWLLIYICLGQNDCNSTHEIKMKGDLLIVLKTALQFFSQHCLHSYSSRSLRFICNFSSSKPELGIEQRFSLSYQQ